MVRGRLLQLRVNSYCTTGSEQSKKKKKKQDERHSNAPKLPSYVQGGNADTQTPRYQNASTCFCSNKDIMARAGVVTEIRRRFLIFSSTCARS